MSDLVERLQKEALGWDNELEDILNEAATRIAALKASDNEAKQLISSLEETISDLRAERDGARAAALREAAEFIMAQSECVSGKNFDRFLVQRHHFAAAVLALADTKATP